MNFYKYNDVIFSELEGFGAKSIEMSAIPPSENNSIDVWGRTGEIFNGEKKKARDIKFSFNVQCYNKDDYEETCQAILDAFDVDEPKAFYIEDEEKFILCKPDGDVNLGDVVVKNNIQYAEGDIKLIAYDPYFYSDEPKMYEGDKELVYVNEGKKPCPCVIDVNIEDEAHYVQVNDNNGNAVLVGSYPVLGNNTVEEDTNIIDEVCETKTNFVNGSIVDANRVVTGGVDQISINNGGFAIVANDFGSGDKWHGPCVRRNIGQQIEDFKVNAYFYFDSTGRLEYNETCSTDKVSTTKYKVTAKTVKLKETRSSTAKTLKTIKYNTYLKPLEVKSGWIKATYDNKTGWIKISTGLKKVTVTTANYYTNRAASLRASGSKKSKLLKTVPAGKPVIAYPNSVSGKYMKCKYSGINGYIYTEYLTKGSNVEIETDEDIVIAENQLGLLEITGLDINNNKLFKFSMCDDNEYYESAYPIIKVGNKTFLEDTKFNVPNPKIKTTAEGSDDKLTVKKEYLNSGKYGNWNDFKGYFSIKRENGKWYAEIVKRNSDNSIIRTLTSKIVTDATYPTGKLNHIEVFFGQYADKEVLTTMCVNGIVIRKLNDTTQEDANIAIFKTGDNISIDTLNERVFKNGELFMGNIDAGSNFFDLDVGENALTISSDSNISSSVIFNEKFNN